MGDSPMNLRDEIVNRHAKLRPEAIERELRATRERLNGAVLSRYGKLAVTDDSTLEKPLSFTLWRVPPGASLPPGRCVVYVMDAETERRMPGGVDQRDLTE